MNPFKKGDYVKSKLIVNYDGEINYRIINSVHKIIEIKLDNIQYQNLFGSKTWTKCTDFDLASDVDIVTSKILGIFCD